MIELEDIISANGLLVEWETAPNSSAEYRLFLRNVTTNTFPIEILTVGTASTGAGEFFISQSRANFTEGNRYRVYVTKVVGNRIIAQSTAEFQIACNFFRFYGGLGWRWPLPNPLSVHISSGYLLPARPGHGGIDIVWRDRPGAIEGEPVYASYDGIVTHSRGFTGGGNTVVIESNVIDPVTGMRIASRYMHMCWGEDNIYQPIVGQQITAGTQIGLVSDTDTPGQYHLHLDILRGGIIYGNVQGFLQNTVNPQRFFPRVKFTGATSTILDGSHIR
jgi:murein DD-endopeptidase MepM/ murein hydrolase activator NlpD